MSGGDPRRMRLITVLVLLGTLAGLTVDAARTPDYVAEAAVAVADPLGEGAGEVDAEAIALLARSDEVIETVGEENALALTSGQIRDAVASAVGDEGEVVIEATAASAELAASLADLVAERTATLARRRSRQALESAAEELRSQIEANEGGEAEQVALARIERALASDSGVSVARGAELPGSPSGVSGLLLALIGAAAGLGVALLTLSVRPLRTPGPGEASEYRDQVQAEAPIPAGEPAEPVSERLRPPTTRVVERLGRPGDLVDAFLGRSADPGRAVRDRLAGLPRRIDPGGPVCVGIAGASDEADSSDLALALAAAAALSGDEVLLADGSAGGAGFAERLGLDPGPGIADYLDGDAEPPEILRQVPVERGLLVVITAGSRRGVDAADIRSQRFGLFVEKVTRAYDLVLLDLGAEPSEIPDSLEALIVAGRTGDSAPAALIAAAGSVPTGIVEIGARPRSRRRSER